MRNTGLGGGKKRKRLLFKRGVKERDNKGQAGGKKGSKKISWKGGGRGGVGRVLCSLGKFGQSGPEEWACVDQGCTSVNLRSLCIGKFLEKFERDSESNV